MRIHLAQYCAAVATALVVAGFNSPEAMGQYATDGSAPEYASPGYGYPAASQPGYAPYASTGYADPAPQLQQSTTPGNYPITPQQPLYVSMNTESGVVKSPASPPASTPAPAPQVAPQNGASSGYGSLADSCDCEAASDYGLSGYFESSGSGRQWFCGIYGLAMERDEPGNARVGLLVSQADVTAAGSYVPVASDTVLNANRAGYEYRGGVELRFGSTFGGGAGYGTCAPQTYAWEFGYWYMAEDPNSAIVVNNDPGGDLRLYSAVNFSGLNIPGLDPVNWVIPIEDTDIPILAGDQRILAERVRTNFSAQSFELNIFRLPIYCNGPACGCGDSYGCCDGARPCGPSFTMTGLCGFRYMRLDDDFQYGLDWGVSDGAGGFDPPAFDGFGSGTDTELFYNISVDNHLAGVQLGCNMNYAVGSCWDFFWDTNFGFYNDHISSTQRVRLGDGTAVTFDNGGSSASVHSSKDTLAFLGEMRLGGAYHVNCNNRLTLAYRAVAIGGVALTTDQIPTGFDNPAYVGLIDSSGSIIMHGLQAGWERKF